MSSTTTPPTAPHTCRGLPSPTSACLVVQPTGNVTCASCDTKLDGILYSNESVKLDVTQGGDNHSSLPDYLVNTIQLGAPWNSTVLNCGNPCTSQTIDLESIGLAAGDVYTVWLRETNATRVVGKGPLSPPRFRRFLS